MLIRNAEALEILEKVTTLVVDKTGTLTEGQPKLVTVVPHGGFDEPQLLAWRPAWRRSASIRSPARIVGRRA